MGSKHLNQYRSHEQFSIEGLEPFIEKVMGKDFMPNVIANLKEIIMDRVDEDEDVEMQFHSRFVLSCYCRLTPVAVVEEKKKPKKVAKKNGKKEKVDVSKKVGKEVGLPKSLEIKEGAKTSQNLINTDSMDSEKNAVRPTM